MWATRPVLLIIYIHPCLCELLDFGDWKLKQLSHAGRGKRLGCGAEALRFVEIY
jgi:hypothetical protein